MTGLSPPPQSDTTILTAIETQTSTLEADITTSQGVVTDAVSAIPEADIAPPYKLQAIEATPKTGLTQNVYVTLVDLTGRLEIHYVGLHRYNTEHTAMDIVVKFTIDEQEFVYEGNCVDTIDGSAILPFLCYGTIDGMSVVSGGADNSVDLFLGGSAPLKCAAFKMEAKIASVLATAETFKPMVNYSKAVADT